MRKTIIVLFIITTISSFAQVNLGLRTSINLSDYSNLDTQKRTNFYFGVIIPVKFGKIYTFQPELNLSKQGATYHLSNTEDYKLFSDYISTSIINKLNINDKFSVLIAPYLSFRTNKDVSTSYTSGGWIISTHNTIHLFTKEDTGIIIGCEYNISKNVSLEARYKQGMVDTIDLEYFNLENIDDKNTTQVFQVGITYKFELKQTKQ